VALKCLPGAPPSGSRSVDTTTTGHEGCQVVPHIDGKERNETVANLHVSR